MGVLQMPKKKSVKLAAGAFIDNVKEIRGFFDGTEGLNDDYKQWCADYAIIRLYLEFEILMLKALVGAINSDTETLFESTGVKFPKHLSEDVCTYLVTGTGYFDFKGREGLLKTIRKFVPKTHYLYKVIKSHTYKDALEKLTALRNFAAHRSEIAKKTARDVTKANKIGSAGAWLRVGDRFETVLLSLTDLAKKIKKEAPY
jgi:hypothetical protein